MAIHETVGRHTFIIKKERSWVNSIDIMSNFFSRSMEAFILDILNDKMFINNGSLRNIDTNIDSRLYRNIWFEKICINNGSLFQSHILVKMWEIDTNNDYLLYGNIWFEKICINNGSLLPRHISI